MLKTLISIGNQIGRNRDEWDDLISIPKIEKNSGKDKVKLNNHVAEIVFDLDARDIYVSNELQAYDEGSSKKWRNIKIFERNGKSVLTCVYAKKNIEQFRKTLFGRGDTKAKGEFATAIEERQPRLITSDLYNALLEIYALKPTFDRKYTIIEKGKITVSFSKLWDGLNLGQLDRIILLFASIKSEALGFIHPTPLKDLNGFDDFFIQPRQEALMSKEGKLRLCYATGTNASNVEVIEGTFSERKSLVKMFQTTLLNYAANFNSKNFNSNYQVDDSVQLSIERGSDYILNNLTGKIAGIDHCIIPEFLSFEPEPSLAKLQKIQQRCDLLFQTEDWEKLTEDIEDDIDSMYWVTFLGFQSDGNYFKTINLIRSVSKHHLNKLIKAFRKLDHDWKDQDDWPWRAVMSLNDNVLEFNLRSIYYIIPIRKSLKNPALTLFKCILENRKIEKTQIFKFFTKLILCHRYERYRGYTNIYPNEHFDFATRDAVFKYLAIIQILKQFRLINGMENSIQTTPEEKSSSQKSDDIQSSIERFFDQMEYGDNQKAMFYLGRILNSVAYAQVQKSHSSKPILNKINFNGIGLKEIERLRLDLTEKIQQYRIHDKTEYTLSQFNQFFKYNGWSMPPQEALFFLLSGYSFSIGSKKSTSSEISTSNQ